MKKLILFIVCLVMVEGVQAQLQQADSLRKKQLAIEKNKDSVLYHQAEVAYEGTTKHENRDEFIQLYILHASLGKRDEKAHIQRVRDLNRKYGDAIAKKLLAGKTWLGMTDKMVIDEFGWADVKRSVTAKAISETWYYLPNNPHCTGNCPTLDYYLVFQKHRLIAIGDL